MNPTMPEIVFAIVIVAVNIAFFVWFQRSRAAATAMRMMRMMTCVGLHAGIAARGDSRTRALMKATRRSCRRCRVEDMCDRWADGKVKGDNAFCPNARAFRALAGSTGPAA
jgi:hypothetical protein